MSPRRANLLNVTFVAAAFAATGAVYSRLPARVPSHWDLAGQVNGWLPKPWGPLLMPLTMAGIYLLFAVIRRVSPKGTRVEPFAGALALVEAALLAFFLALTIVMLLAGLGQPVSVNRVVSVGLGLLFVVFGSFMGKFTRNFFVGIRTPWTLANDEVWRRTHRLGGKVFVAGGLVVLAAALVGGSSIGPVLVLPLVALVPAVYSYVLYRRLEGPRR
jgi:uncharacterized membrane protein